MNTDSPLLCTRFALGIIFWLLGYVASKVSDKFSGNVSTVVVPGVLWLLCGSPLSGRRVTRQGFLLQLGGMLYVMIEMIASLTQTPPLISFRFSFWTMVLSLILVGLWFRLTNKEK